MLARRSLGDSRRDCSSKSCRQQLRIATIIAMVLGVAVPSGVGAQAAPDISVAGTLDFGDVPNGYTSDLVLTVSNPGTATLVITDIASSKSEYTFSSTSFSVAPAASEDVTVTFAPTSNGNKAATMTITHNATGSTSAVSLAGMGRNPQAKISVAASLSLDNAVVGASTSQTLTISNTGNISLDITSITLSGANAAEFSVSATTLSVPAGQSSDVTVTFTPTSAGSKAATLTIDSNGSGNGIVTLGGTGNAPGISVAASLASGNILSGSSGTQTLTISNSGDAALNISNITLSGANAGEFSVSATSLTINAGQSQDVTVTFAPTSAGTRSASLSITHDAVGTPTSVSLSGTGTGPGISVSADLGLGNSVSGSSSSQVLTISNSGDAALNISNITRSGANAAEFSVSATSLTINAGQSQDVTVTFSPTSAGSKSASLSIAHDAVGTPTSVSLSGTGTSPVISVPATLASGNILSGSSRTQTLTISNSGDATLNISNITLSGANAAEFSVSATSFAINAGQSQDVTVTFAPTSAGSKSASLSIAHDAVGTPTSVSLSGTGTLAVVMAPTISVVASLDLGSTDIGSTTSQTLTVSNTGDAALSVSNITLSGANAAEFSVSATSFAINAGQSQDVTVTFAPTSAGTKSASLSITHDAVGTPTSVSLSGTGTAAVVLAPAISAPTFLSLGAVDVGATASQALTISNSGDAALNISNITLSGTNAGEFSVSVTSLTIIAGQSQDVTVTIAPTSTGSKYATLSIQHNASGGDASVALDGTGATTVVSVPEISVVASLSFGNVVGGESGTQLLTIENNGNASLNISNLTLTGQNGTEFTVSPQSQNIPPGQSQDFTVTFTPTSAGSKSATLTIQHNASGSDASVSLDGTSTAAIISNPGISVSSTLSFGSQAVGTSLLQVLTVHSTGDTQLDILNISVSGADAEAFSVSPTRVSIGAGYSVGVMVTFAPTSPGSKSAWLTIQHNALGGATRVSINGVGTTREINVQDSLSFGNVDVGYSGSERLAIFNVGNATLSIVSIALSGTDHADYSVSSTELYIGGDQNQVLTVTFAPLAAGPKVAKLSIEHDGPGSPTTVSLSGTATAPVISIPDTIFFGQVDEGKSVRRTLTILNAGTGSLGFSDLTLSGEAAPDFVVSSTSGNIAPGESQDVTLTYSPSLPGTRLATLLIEHNGADSPSRIVICGTCSAPEIATADSLVFGIADIGNTSSRTLKVTNTGDALLKIRRIAISGDDAGDFSVSTVAQDIHAEQNEDLTITFEPTTPGMRSAVLFLYHNSSTSTTSISLNGIGAEPEILTAGISVSDFLAFGPAQVESSKTEVLTVASTGKIPLEITNITLSGENAGEFSVSATTLSIKAGQSQDVTITFGPSLPESYSVALLIYHNAAESPTGITMSGTGTQPSISVPDSLLFGDAHFNAPSLKKLIISSTGNVPLDITHLTISGDDAADFSVSSANLSIGAGLSEDVAFTFTPSSPGTKSATLRVEHNGPGGAASVTLWGNCTAPDIVLPVSLSFGEANLNDTASQRLLIANTGGTTFKIRDITVSGVDAAEFSVSTKLLSIDVGQVEDLVLTFIPTSSGEKFATLSFIQELTGIPSSLALSGIGHVPEVVVPDSEIKGDFNADGKNDLADFILFMQSFGTMDPRYDLDQNGQVNLADFIIFVENYGRNAREF